MVVQFGVCSPEYFMDKMKPYELQVITEGLHLRYRDSWEQTRMIAYTVAQVNSRKRLKPKDIMVFPWEEEVKGKKPRKVKSIDLTKDFVETVRKQALEREKELSKKGII